ncbi:hypothetical protein GOODEAATRI_011595 [Goodea atripinnis]|uniref:Uncharacterized protein n=1 Tax=Goodea atripinnis TaxID=208336 RepID=A0ABV0N9U5_9TELE
MLDVKDYRDYKVLNICSLTNRTQGIISSLDARGDLLQKKMGRAETDLNLFNRRSSCSSWPQNSTTMHRMNSDCKIKEWMAPVYHPIIVWAVLPSSGGLSSCF